MFKINRNLELALLAIEQLREQPKMRIEDISVSIGASRIFLDRIMNRLTRAGITESFKGPRGGVSLVSLNVSVLDVAVALGYKIEPNDKISGKGRNLKLKIDELLSSVPV